jgi:ABC-type sulfate/molybdate transport systems ATPase subunit
VETLELDIAIALRSFELGLSLSAGRETVALVGPSGAGKTTVLRAVAGLRRPDRGRIALAGEPWFDAAAGVDLPPERRSVGLVFQEYALFPHMSVRENVAFGGAARAGELLDRLGIAHLARERPGAISGGERQRVALARALARDPAVLALDEPLSALDAHTRAAVRSELQDVLGELAIPTLLVTHDFGDAAALADRIGVLVAGRLRQLGPASELVRAPADAFVAALTGANVLRGHARALAGGGSEVALDGGGVVRSADRADGPVAVAVQPWDIAVRPGRGGADAHNVLPGSIAAVTPEGDRVRVRVGELVAECAAADAAGLQRGALAYATFPPTATRLTRVAP